MQKSVRNVQKTAVTACRFNYNKLQAVLCMALSAACSISLIYWAIKGAIKVFN
ncbi:MAG TPA: hypothetical protein VF427_12895 [Noviherbaspirillum sp.]